MNILHIWDQSGVACVLAKHQQKMGHSVKILRRSGYDPYGIYEFYHQLVRYSLESDFLETCVKEASNADIVHVHSRTDALFYLKKKLNRRNKIVMHFHGSDLRGISQKYDRELWNIPKTIFRNYRSFQLRKRNNLIAEQMADRVLYSTPDLRNYLKRSNPFLLNIPVDTDHFTKTSNSQVNDTFFTFNTEAISNIKWIVDFCKSRGIENLQVIDRTKYPVNYSEMPDLLKRFGTYVDIRYVNNNVLSNLSTTALQSLACGLRVIDYGLKYRYDLPKEHHALNAAKIVEQIYEEII